MKMSKKKLRTTLVHLLFSFGLCEPEELVHRLALVFRPFQVIFQSVESDGSKDGFDQPASDESDGDSDSDGEDD